MRKPMTPPPARTPEDTLDLAAEIAALRSEVRRLNGHRFVRIQNSYWRLMLLQLMKGLMVGLGTVLGASILVSIVAYFLSQIEVLPIIGKWATQVIEQIEEGQIPRDSPYDR